MPNGCLRWVCVDVLEGNQTGLSLRASGPLPAVAGLLGDTAGSGRLQPCRAPLLTQGRFQTQGAETPRYVGQRGGNLGKESKEMLSLTVPRAQVIQLAERWHVLSLHPAIPGQEGRSK